MWNLEKTEKRLLIVLMAALLIGVGILVYRKSCPVGNLRISYSGTGPGPGARHVAKEGKKININEATAEELANLKGVGTVLAHRIVDYRTKNGLFVSIDDIKRVPGIGNALFARIKDDVVIE